MLAQCRREDSNLHSLNGNQVLNLARQHFPRKASAVDSCSKPFRVSTFRRISWALALYAPGGGMGNSVGKMLAKWARRMAPCPPGFLADLVAPPETEKRRFIGLLLRKKRETGSWGVCDRTLPGSGQPRKLPSAPEPHLLLPAKGPDCAGFSSCH